MTASALERPKRACSMAYHQSCFARLCHQYRRHPTSGLSHQRCMYLEGSHKVRLTVEEAANCGIRRGRGDDSTNAVHVDASHTAGLINAVFTGVLNDTSRVNSEIINFHPLRYSYGVLKCSWELFKQYKLSIKRHQGEQSLDCPRGEIYEYLSARLHRFRQVMRWDDLFGRL